MSELARLIEESGMSIKHFVQAMRDVSGYNISESTIKRTLTGKFTPPPALLEALTETARQVVYEAMPIFFSNESLHRLDPLAIEYAQAEQHDPQVGSDYDYFVALKKAHPKLKKISHVFFHYLVDTNQ